jgi:hypothetical protein
MNKAELIKEAISAELAKEGKTLLDLERALSKEAGGGGLFFSPESFTNVGKGLLNLYGASALAVGALGGTGAYMGLRANEDSTNQQLKKIREKQQYEEATRSLIEHIKNPSTL